MRAAVCGVVVGLFLWSAAFGEKQEAGKATANGKEDTEARAVDPGVVEKVLSSVRENYRPLRAVKARIRCEIISNFTMGPAPANPPPQAAKGGGAGAGTLKIQHSPREVFEWISHLSGENQRHEVLIPPRGEIITADAVGVTEHARGRAEAVLMPWTNPKLRGALQRDPREAGFMAMAERLHILLIGKLSSARFVERGEDETIAEIKIPSDVVSNTLLIECSSRFNYLPTRVVYVLDDGRINAFTDLTYQQVGDETEPSWFLTSAVRRNSFPHQNRSPDDKEWGQVTTITVHDLETDVVPPPPREDAQTLPAGTEVKDLFPKPIPPPAPVPAVFSSVWVIVGAAAAVLIVVGVLYVWLSRMRGEEV
jgi:hypothetical protein